jgi:hypothetical protein
MKNTRSDRPCNLIVAYDGSGRPHWLHVVQHLAGRISLVDGEVLRIMTPSAASVLVLELVSALGRCLRRT